MYKGIHWFTTLLLIVLISSVTALSQGVQVKDTLWIGNDFIIQLSDSVGYEVDLTKSDSSTLVIRFFSSLESDEGVITSPDGIKTSLSRDGSDGIRILRIQKNGRLGYSTLWRPYSNRLVVHTFVWDELNRAETDYHRGLLSLEQGLPELAKEQLSAARATSKDSSASARRAASILGILYAREGKDSLAMIYLKAPLGPDDYMARAEVRRRAGDDEEATKDEQMFQSKVNSDFSIADSPTETNRSTDTDVAGTERELSEMLKSWRGILLIALAAIVIISLATWFTRKPEKTSSETPTTGPPETLEAVPSSVGTETEEEIGQAVDPRASSLVAPEIVIDTEELIEVEEPSTTASEPHAQTRDPETQRSSRQADQLRQRMEAATANAQEPEDSSGQKEMSGPNNETTISEARKLNVSRDYVELRNRIAELRHRIDSSD
ncbi:MAG: hypothetical protein J4G05_01900 [Chlorobi bacterium]|nr:hypothetical protein [Chlorobiota bacterium]